MPCRPWALFASLWLLFVPAARAETDRLSTDLVVLRTAGVPVEGAGLLAFFKKRTLSEEMRTKIAGLIRLLGGDEYSTRERATNDLIDMGPATRTLLIAAQKDANLEVRRRARWTLEKIGPVSEELPFLPAAARVLAQRKPVGAAETLLNFLPNIEDPDVAEEVGRSLAGVALDKDGNPEPTLLLALGDRHAIKRHAAAAALLRAGGAAQRPGVRKLLNDADPGVRRRVALALLEARDKEAVPTLIALLTAASTDDAAAAEEALTAIAGDKAPVAPEHEAPGGREKVRQAWEAWWKDARAGIDLTKIDLTSAGRGVTLVALMDASATDGKVQELDNSGKPRWSIGGLRYPIYASMTRRDRVLICEYYGNRVTERDLKGRVLWEKIAGAQLLSAQRLANGNTFIAARNLLLEVDPAGASVKSIPRPFDILAAERHKDGTMTVITSSGACAKLDGAGRQTSSFPIGNVTNLIGFKPHFLPRGGVVVPDYSRGQIREYNAAGKRIREVAAVRPNSVTRLPNGHLLVGSRMSSQIFELDREGVQISAWRPEGRPLFVDRR